MLRTPYLAAVLLLPLLTGCSDKPPEPKPEEVARSQMLGMSLGETYTCLGEPVHKLLEGHIETWTYRYGVCVADLTIVENKVSSVDYSIKPLKAGKVDINIIDPLAGMDEPCEHVPLVASCVRWLRRN